MRERIYWICVVVIFIVAAAAVGIVGYNAFSAYNSTVHAVGGGAIPNSMERLGQTGDFFGGILNPIVSLLALVALLVGLGLQSKQVHDARTDADAARAEAKAQTALAHRQSFESVYFNLLNMHARSLDQIKYEEGNTEIWGASALAAHAQGNDISISYDPHYSPRLVYEEFKQRGQRFMRRSSHLVNSYSSIVEQILAFVSEYPMEKEADKKRYINIYKSLISPQEFQALLLVCLSNPKSRLSSLIIKYDLASSLSTYTGYDTAMSALKTLRQEPQDA